MPIKAIIFVGGVVIAYDRETELRNLAALCPDPLLAYQRLPQLWQPAEVHSGRLGSEKCYRLMVEQLGAEVDYSAFIKARISGIGHPIPGIETLVDAIRSRLQVALLSDTNAEHWRCVTERYAALLAKLEPHFLSFQLGMSKPEAEIYDRVTRELGVRPADCLFIDDTEANVLGARDAGLDAITFTDWKQLRGELAARGLWMPMAAKDE